MTQHARLQSEAPSLNLFQLPGLTVDKWCPYYCCEPWMGKGKESVHSVTGSLRIPSDTLDCLWSQSKSIFPQKPMTFRKKTQYKKKKKSPIRKYDALVKRLRYTAGKQHWLSTDASSHSLQWSIVIFFQERSLRLKQTFFKVVDEGLFDSVSLRVQCRETTLCK